MLVELLFVGTAEPDTGHGVVGAITGPQRGLDAVICPGLRSLPLVHRQSPTIVAWIARGVIVVPAPTSPPPPRPLVRVQARVVHEWGPLGRDARVEGVFHEKARRQPQVVGKDEGKVHRHLVREDCDLGLRGAEQVAQVIPGDCAVGLSTRPTGEHHVDQANLRFGVYDDGTVPHEGAVFYNWISVDVTGNIHRLVGETSGQRIGDGVDDPLLHAGVGDRHRIGNRIGAGHRVTRCKLVDDESRALDGNVRIYRADGFAATHGLDGIEVYTYLVRRLDPIAKSQRPFARYLQVLPDDWRVLRINGRSTDVAACRHAYEFKAWCQGISNQLQHSRRGNAICESHHIGDPWFVAGVEHWGFSFLFCSHVLGTDYTF